MRKLILFDIDGTLIDNVGDDHKFRRTIRKVHDIEVRTKGDFRGYTDYLILGALLEGEGWDDAMIDTAMPVLLAELERDHAANFEPERVVVLPGVVKLLDALERQGTVLGLITGNMKSISERKLATVGLWDYFTVGGFGNDPHKVRADLVRLAVERAGFSNESENVWVIGDTPRDIEAIHAAGLKHSVGVANGFRPLAELEAAGAEVVFEDLRNTELVVGKLLSLS